MIDIKFKDEQFHLYMNGTAHFNALERFDKRNVLEAIEGDDRKNYEATLWLFAELSQQGELYRRMLGMDSGKMLKFSTLLVSVQPNELADIKAAVIAAIAEGYRTTEPGEEDDDPWLREFEEKNSKKKHLPRRNTSSLSRRGLAYLFRRG